MSAWRGISRGLAGALVAPLLWIVVSAAPALWAILGGRLSGTSGSASIMVDSNHLLLAALVGFVAGVWWSRRR